MTKITTFFKEGDDEDETAGWYWTDHPAGSNPSADDWTCNGPFFTEKEALKDAKTRASSSPPKSEPLPPLKNPVH